MTKDEVELYDVCLYVTALINKIKESPDGGKIFYENELANIESHANKAIDNYKETLKGLKIEKVECLPHQKH